MAYLWRAYIRRGLCTEGNLRFKIDWASLINGRKLPFLLCFTLYLRAISEYKPPEGAYIWRGDLTEGVLRYEFGGLTFGGAYTWRGLFSEFYGMFIKQSSLKRTPLLGIGTIEVPVGVFTVHVPLYIFLNNSFLWHL